MLAPIAARFLPVTVGNPRSCSATELGKLLREQHPAVPCEEHESLLPALRRAETEAERILICGSLFLVGEALFALELTDGPPETSSQ